MRSIYFIVVQFLIVLVLSTGASTSWIADCQTTCDHCQIVKQKDCCVNGMMTMDDQHEHGGSSCPHGSLCSDNGEMAVLTSNFNVTEKVPLVAVLPGPWLDFQVPDSPLTFSISDISLTGVSPALYLLNCSFLN